MALTNDSTSSDPSTWTPEEIMLNHRGELTGDLLIRCAEWYTNEELEQKVNQARALPIKSSNYFSSFKRAMTAIALQEGRLPAIHRLQFDKRRLANLTARFEVNNKAVGSLQASITHRESSPHITLPANPTLQELEAARPEGGHQARKKAVETRDYWFKFYDALQTRYTQRDLMTVYHLAQSVAYDEMKKAERIVKRSREVEILERDGTPIPQVYTPPKQLQAGQKIYVPPFASASFSATRSKKRTAAAQKDKANTENSNPTPTRQTRRTPLISTRVKQALYRTHDRLRLRLRLSPPKPLNLSALANALDLPIDIPTATAEEHAALATCETESSLAAYRAWCTINELLLVKQYGRARVAECLCLLIRAWLDDVARLEDLGAQGPLEEGRGERFLGRAVGLEKEVLGGGEDEVGVGDEGLDEFDEAVRDDGEMLEIEDAQTLEGMDKEIEPLEDGIDELQTGWKRQKANKKKKTK
ncbi:hypothetical protein Q7P37_007539 [Cladosporium fusiforme]